MLERETLKWLKPAKGQIQPALTPPHAARGGCLGGGHDGGHDRADFHASATRKGEPVGIGGDVWGEHGGIARLEMQPRYVKL